MRERKGYTLIELLTVLIIVVVVVLSFSITLGGCDGTGGCSQYVSRRWGGTYIVNLPPGKKLVTVTWKEGQLWKLTRDRKPGEPLSAYEFKEDSNWGVLEGSVIINEVEIPGR